jgi:hypothetical protein
MRPPDKDTPSKIYGRAVHKIALEGRDAFEARFAPKLTNWATKEGKIEKERFGLSGQEPLDVEDYQRAILTGEILRTDPVFSAALTGGIGKEVSVFWENDRGIKKKARFDILKLRAIVDLKNISNERNLSFPRACLRKLDEFSWHIQAEHYREGRLAMKDLFDKGLVFGECDTELLRLACESTEFAWVWIFIQNSGAPLVHGLKISYQAEEKSEDGELIRAGFLNPIFQMGRARINVAEENFIRGMTTFAEGEPWIASDPIKELDISDLPVWFGREDPIN